MRNYIRVESSIMPLFADINTPPKENKPNQTKVTCGYGEYNPGLSVNRTPSWFSRNPLVI